jgi:EF hand
MRKRWTLALAIAFLSVTGATIVPTAAQKATPGPNASLSTRDKRLAAGEEYCKKLLLLMDKNKDGKVSREEFMNYMQAEFDRLDRLKDGQLDATELTRLEVRPYVGK